MERQLRESVGAELAMARVAMNMLKQLGQVAVMLEVVGNDLLCIGSSFGLWQVQQGQAGGDDGAPVCIGVES